MTLNLTVQEVPKTVPVGQYDGYVTKIDQIDGEFGEILKLTFVILTEDEFNEQEINGICSTTLHEKSKLGRWITAITGKPLAVGENITDTNILSKDCRVVVEHTERNGMVFANVVNVLPRES